MSVFPAYQNQPELSLSATIEYCVPAVTEAGEAKVIGTNDSLLVTADVGTDALARTVSPGAVADPSRIWTVSGVVTLIPLRARSI